MTGKVIHFEIPADDVERANDFYSKAFGWQISSIPELDYTSLGTTASDDAGLPTEPGAINGGLFAREPDLSSPVITIDTDDIDATLAKVEELGGQVVRKGFSVGDIGSAAYFLDTEGNLMGLWQTAPQ